MVIPVVVKSVGKKHGLTIDKTNIVYKIYGSMKCKLKTILICEVYKWKH